MFSKFNLKGFTKDNGIFDEYDYLTRGEELYNINKRKIENDLADFTKNDGTIDGTSLQNAWFPHNQIKFDVFLSHSHADKELAIQVSGWLNVQFGINTFIDSCLWGYANNLLKEIDEEHCKKITTGNYDYEKRNYSTSHVHMMLSIALSKVIDNTECVMFLNTPNSVSWIKEFDVTTISPWIYHELAMTTMIKRTPLEQYREALFENVEKKMKITYDVTEYLKELIDLDINDLNNWCFKYKSSKICHPLDVLYKSIHKQPNYSW